jgi:hypothetical protein
MAVLKQLLARQQCRRQGYQLGRLQVWWEGEVRRRYDPGVGRSTPFRVPLQVSSLDLVGDDAGGALLLAMVPLPGRDTVAAGSVQELVVPLAGGQILTITIALDEETRGEAGGYVIQLNVEPAAVRVLLTPPPGGTSTERVRPSPTYPSPPHAV